MADESQVGAVASASCVVEVIVRPGHWRIASGMAHACCAGAPTKRPSQCTMDQLVYELRPCRAGNTRSLIKRLWKQHRSISARQPWPRSSSINPASAADSLATYRAKRDFAKTAEPSGATKTYLGERLPGPEARSDPASLRLPSRTRRCAAELGSDARPRALNPDDKRLAGQDRRSSARLCNVRGHDPQGSIRRRHSDAVGQWHLGNDRRQGPAQDHPRGTPPLHPSWSSHERRVDHDQAEA